MEDRVIFLTDDQNIGLMRTREKFRQHLESIGIWFETRRISDSWCIINEDILRKHGFDVIADYLNSIGSLDLFIIRRLMPEDIVKIPISEIE